jgi:hypothetical protein
MAYDLHIGHACPHVIRQERVTLTNQQIISPKSPISGTGLLEVRRDGVLLLPEGNTREAFSLAPLKPPYRIRSTSNELSISTSSGFQATIMIPAKIYQGSALVEYLSGKLGDINVEVENLALKFTDNLVGVGFTLTGSALKALGYARPKVVVKSKKVTPEWKLVKRVNGYDLLFQKPLQPEGLLDITYTTAKEFCRRCDATGVENDIRFDDYGETQTLRGTDLLYQNVAKAVLTRQGSNPYHHFYGSTAFSLIGRKSSVSVADAIRLSVTQALSKVQDQQRAQGLVQTLTPEEKLLGVESVRVSALGDDLTHYVCSIVVRSGAGRSVSVNVIFAVPGSIPLNGELT